MIKSSIRQLALSLGFDAVGFAAPGISQRDKDQLHHFLAQHYHGEMAWLEEKFERRSDPKNIWPDVQSIIVLAHNYGPSFNPMERLIDKQTGVISAYALNLDYHDIIKKKLKLLAERIAKNHGGDARVYVDTAPVMEKTLASQTGIGWQGKHSCVVSREFGSWLFLGEIFTSLAIEPDLPETNHCGSCTRCLDICPTQAFDKAGVLDARKCISYLTIEHKTHIGREFRKAMGNRIYGCDDCLAVCPWNKFAQTAQETAYHPRAELEAPLLAELARLDDTAFRALFRKSPVKRIGRDRFVRNVLIAIGNSGNPELLGAVLNLLSAPSPLVRAMAVWACGELAQKEDFLALRGEFLPNEQDQHVREEWR